MSAGENIKWFAFGFALAAPVGVFVWPNAGHAQSAPVTTVQALPQRQPPLSQRPGTPPQRTLEDDPDRPDTAPRPATGGDPDDPDRPTRGDGDPEPEPDAPTVQIGRRVAPDGDPNAIPEQPQPPQDGVILDGQPPGPTPETVDPLKYDTRSRADSGAFEVPLQGYEALAFQIELDPILDRRPTRLARFEPYDPIGYRKGSIVIFPDIEIGATASNNIFRTSPGKGDVIVDARPTLRAVTDWRQHAIEVKATGFFSHYGEFTTENDRAYALEARGRYDFSRRTNVEVLFSRALDQELRSSLQAPTDARARSDIETSRAAVALNHRFNRLSVQLRGALTDVDVKPTTANDGSTITNVERGNVQREAAVRVAYQFKPSLSAFTEYAANTRDFNAAPLTDGIIRSSSGDRLRFGVSFGNTGQFLRGEVSAGYGNQRPDDARLGSIAGLIVDANLAWRPTAITSVLFNVRSDFVDSFNIGTAGSITRLGSVELRHAFQRQLVASAALSYAVADYKGITQQDKTATGTLGVEYFLNRNAVLFSNYQHVNFDSTSGSAYSVDTVRVGMKLRQ